MPVMAPVEQAAWASAPSVAVVRSRTGVSVASTTPAQATSVKRGIAEHMLCGSSVRTLRSDQRPCPQVRNSPDGTPRHAPASTTNSRPSQWLLLVAVTVGVDAHASTRGCTNAAPVGGRHQQPPACHTCCQRGTTQQPRHRSKARRSKEKQVLVPKALTCDAGNLARARAQHKRQKRHAAQGKSAMPAHFSWLA